MTLSTKLEEAIEYRDRLNELLTFKGGFGIWGGPVECSFGSYKVTLSKVCSDEIAKAIEVEERMLRNTLDMLGAKVVEEPL